MVRLTRDRKQAQAITAPSRQRGADLAAAGWSRGPNRNALDAFSYSSLIAAPDGQTALSAEVMMTLPNTMNSDLVTCAEVRIENLAAWATALTAAGAPPRPDLRLSIQEVADFFAVAWQTATEQLAAVVTASSTTTLWLDPPTVELRLTTERRYDGTPAPQLMLDDYLDLHTLGHSDRGQLREMAVTITAPQYLEQPDRRNKTREALVFMAHQFGFLEADKDCL